MRDEARTKDHCYVVLDGKVFVAAGRNPPGEEFTTDLYRNLEDFRAGKTAEENVTLAKAGIPRRRGHAD